MSSLFDTWWHTRSLRLLFGRGARTQCSRGSNLRALWVFLYEKAPLSSVSLFEGGGASVSRPTVAEARRGLNSWGSQTELADELERGLSLSRSSAANEGERLDDDDAISLTSSDPAASALLGYAQEELEMSEGDEAEAEPDQSSCPAYDELLEVMERTMARLDLPWKRAKMVAPRGRLDEPYLSVHNRPARVSLPFLPDLHAEVEREWKKPFSARIHRLQHTSYANVEGMRENGYEKMPPVEETLASYLSVGETSSLKGIVHPKMKILSSFTHPQVVPNLYECLCSAEHKGRYSEECEKQSSSGAPLTSIVFLFLLWKSMVPQNSLVTNFLQISSFVFGRTKKFIQVWNYLRVSKWWQNFHFWVNYPFKAPSLPSKPLQETSRLNGKAYAAAGQAVASLHTMAVLQAYQADLLKDLDKGQGLSPDEMAELRRTTDLALRATKQAATAMGRSMAIGWEIVGLCGASMVIRSPALQFQDLRV